MPIHISNILLLNLGILLHIWNRIHNHIYMSCGDNLHFFQFLLYIQGITLYQKPTKFETTLIIIFSQPLDFNILHMLMDDREYIGSLSTKFNHRVHNKRNYFRHDEHMYLHNLVSDNSKNYLTWIWFFLTFHSDPRQLTQLFRFLVALSNNSRLFLIFLNLSLNVNVPRDILYESFLRMCSLLFDRKSFHNKYRILIFNLTQLTKISQFFQLLLCLHCHLNLQYHELNPLMIFIIDSNIFRFLIYNHLWVCVKHLIFNQNATILMRFESIQIKYWAIWYLQFQY